MVPIGFSMMDGVARMAPYFSLADAADFIQERIAPNDKIVYEGPMHVGSSLLFYLGRKFYLVNQDPASEPGAALRANPGCLPRRKDRHAGAGTVPIACTS